MIKTITNNSRHFFYLVRVLFRKSRQFLLTFFYIKFFLTIFYLISDYQSFSFSTIRMILQINIFNDSLVLIFSVSQMIASLIHYQGKVNRFFNFLFGLLNFLLAVFTIVFSAAVLVITG